MNIELYSDRAKQAIQSAQSLALARRHQQFAPEHLLKVLLEEKDGLSRALIQSAGGRPDQADAAVEAGLSRIYAGQHFRFDHQAGEHLGDQVAHSVLGSIVKSR